MPLTREQFQELLCEERLALYKRCKERFEEWRQTIGKADEVVVGGFVCSLHRDVEPCLACEVLRDNAMRDHS